MRLRTLTLTALAAFAVTSSPAVAAKKAPKTLKVMTRNLYLGGDITRPIRATAGKEGFAALTAFANANDELRKIIDQTNFPARAKLLAAEIATNKPDLVALQEVALWRRGDLDLGHLGRADSVKVDYDFLKLLMAQLKKKKAGYQVVRVQNESDVEGPAFPQSNPLEANGFDARLTMRDVILRRKASKVKITKASSKQYKAKLSVSVSGVSFDFLRGAVWADAKLGKKSFRFIATHLESQTAALALAQAQELLAGPAAVKGRSVIVGCDCNSDMNETSGGDGDQAAYLALTGTAPYAAVGVSPLFDTWTFVNPNDPGFTSGFSELVNDADASKFNHRIDLVLGRTAKGAALPVVSSKITGITKKTAGGLWPSDHAGVVAVVKP